MDPQALIKWIDEENLGKITVLKNPGVVEFLDKYLALFNPKSVFVCDGSSADIQHIKDEAIKNHEEIHLAGKHTLHYDNIADQGRDKGKTKFLLSKDNAILGESIDWMDRDEGIKEVTTIMKNSMADRTAYILFFCLGPVESEFSIPAIQITDSAYVGHSELILYRYGYQAFKHAGAEFFKFVHTQGELDTINASAGAKPVSFKVSKNMDMKRIYIDLEDRIVYSANTQYGGNTIGLKKLAMRHAIYKGSKEGWLTEHMFVMGVNGPGGRVSYFTGAFPSMCGKTSTAMIGGERIVGDDIAYLREREGKAHAVNVEKGIFGIIEGVNEVDDPLIFAKLKDPNQEIIFSNVLLTEDFTVYWNGMDKNPAPTRGVNFSGQWEAGKKGADGGTVSPSHKNARFTINIDILENADVKALHDKHGCLVKGYIYGGRDVDTSVPVEQSFDFEHGIIFHGAALESETTAATLGQAGVRVFNPMSNIDFLSVPIGKYIAMNLDFGKKLAEKPAVFHVNYFLQDETGKWLNDKTDKAVWLKWMEGRVAGELGAIEAPMGFIPTYNDLKRLFKEILSKEYTREAYDKQFSIRAAKLVEKIERIRKIYDAEDAWIRAHSTDPSNYVPAGLYGVLDDQRQRLETAVARHGPVIAPVKLE